VRFPLTGVLRSPESVGARAGAIAHVVRRDYGPEGVVLLWGGLLALVAGLVVRAVRAPLGAVLRDPYTTVVMLSCAGLVAFSLHDFQGYPDVYPLLPYAAVGAGEAVFAVRGRLRLPVFRRASAAVAVAGLAALVAVSWASYVIAGPRDTELLRERAAAREIERMLGAHGALYALGDPTPLVLTGRRNPSRYIYLGSGVARWAARHTYGSMAAWRHSISEARPAVITLAGWSPASPWENRMERWLRAHYAVRDVERWTVFVPRT
jgi:hypothetical protein